MGGANRRSADNSDKGRRVMTKPGDINEDGKEIEQDGNITWEQGNESKGISKTIRGSEQTGTRL